MTCEFPDSDCSHIQFAILGTLAERSRTDATLRRVLDSQFGWNPPSGPSALSALLKRFEEAGLIFSTECDGESANSKVWLLTRKGFQHWARHFDYVSSAISRLGDARLGKTEADFAALADLPPRAKTRQRVVERAPTQEEREAILRAARKDFQSIYQFSCLVRVRPTALVNARIENVDFKAGQLTLEAVADSGRRIGNRVVEMPPAAVRLLREIVGDRKSGVIFRRPGNSHWTTVSLSTVFRSLRKKLGLSSEISLSGRGGRVGRISESPGEEARPEKDKS